METTVKTRPVRFSYSSLRLFEKCRLAWKYRYIDGLVDQAGAAASRGSRVHEAGERYLKGEIPVERLPVEYKEFLPTMELMKAMGAESEAVWMVDRRWGKVNDEKAAWLKAIIDIHYLLGDELHIIDLKTGRFSRGYTEQLEFYAVVAASIYPNITRVHARCFYLDERSTSNEITYPRDWLVALRATWEEKMQRMETEEMFFASPGWACKFCSFRGSKGGPCNYEAT